MYRSVKAFFNTENAWPARYVYVSHPPENKTSMAAKETTIEVRLSLTFIDYINATSVNLIGIAAWVI